MAGRLSQPGCYTNTGSGAKSGRSIVRLEGIPPEMNWNRRIPAMRGSTRRGEIRKKKNQRSLLGRRAAVLQFSTEPDTFDFKTKREAVQVALRKFRAACAASSRTAVEILAEKKQHDPALFVNRLHDGEGHVPGNESGDCFESRAELSLVGLHRQPQAGIDWKVIQVNGKRKNIALCIVVCGGYEDDVDEGETLIYTGEGGNDSQRMKRQYEDQKLVRGNLAMCNSIFEGKPVRVIRGRPDPNNSRKKLQYSYDGLYKVVDYELTPGTLGFKVFKFKLVREGGQKPLLWPGPVIYKQKRARGFEPFAQRKFSLEKDSRKNSRRANRPWT